MDQRNKTRRYPLAVVVAVVVLFASVTGVVAFAQPDGGDVFTGCLNETSGSLRNVALGFEPARPCNDQEVQITWDRAGAALEARIAALEERVAELEEPFGTLELLVDCAAGDTVGEAVADADTHFGPVSITISGVCEENAVIERSDVTLSGVEPTDGIQAADPGLSTLTIVGAHGLELSNLTISGGRTGIHVVSGAVLSATGVTVRDSTGDGVRVGSASTAYLNDCTILNHPIFGVSASGTVGIIDSEISGNGQGLFAASGTIRGALVHVHGNGNGANAFSGGTLTFFASVFEENVTGVTGEFNGSVKVGGSSLIANNEGPGVVMSNGSVFSISDDSIIENNGGSGIEAYGGSSVTIGFPNPSIVRNNAGDGVFLRDLSTGGVGDPASQIVDNGGWGVNCAGPAAITSAQHEGLESVDLSGNATGPTNCPVPPEA